MLFVIIECLAFRFEGSCLLQHEQDIGRYGVSACLFVVPPLEVPLLSLELAYLSAKLVNDVDSLGQLDF